MTIDKHGKNWRIRFYLNGKQKSISCDHEPTKKEAKALVQELMNEAQTQSESADTFENLAKEYIESKRAVLSPNTVRGYMSDLKRISENFKKLKINDIDQLSVQREVSQIAASYSPKTTKNANGLISAVLKMYRPKLSLTVKLPQAEKKDFYCPTDEEVKKILEMAKPTRYYVAFCLGVMGMRRGEIAAATLGDLNGNILTVKSATYTDDKNNHGIKTTKTTDSTRNIFLPDELVKRINEQGYIYDGAESRLWASLSDMQAILGIKHFRFHDLRAYFATYAHLMGIPDRVIQDTAGWKTDYTMKKIYRRTQEQTNQEKQKEYWSNLGI